MRRGVGGHAAALAGLWLFFLALHVAALPGEVDQEWRAGRGGAHGAGSCSPSQGPLGTVATVARRGHQVQLSGNREGFSSRN